MITENLFGIIAETFGLFLFSIVKFLYAPGLILASGYSPYFAVVLNTVAGVSGVMVFYLFGRLIFKTISRFFPEKKRKTFSPSKRRLIKVKNRSGLIGLAAIVPLVSIPVSAIIASKYFKKPKKIVAVYTPVLFVWSIIITLFSEAVIQFIKQMLNV